MREARHSGGHHSSFGTPTEAPFGFFVDGSSIPGINGMYGPKLPHTGTDGQVREVPERLQGQIHLGAYPHDSSGWWLVNLRHGFGPEASGGPEWVLIDPRWRHRFRHPGAASVPGYGLAWSHVRRGRGHREDGAVEYYEDADERELPKLLGPIPDDQNDCRTSFMFEQLLVQLVRQRSAVAKAEAMRAKDILNSSTVPAQNCPAYMTAMCPSATNATHAGYEGAADVLISDGAFKEAAECLGAAAWTSTTIEGAAEKFLRQATAARQARDFEAAVTAARAVLGSCSGPAVGQKGTSDPNQNQNPLTLIGRAHLTLGQIYLDSGRVDDAMEAMHSAYAALATSGKKSSRTDAQEQLERMLVMTVAASRRLHPPIPRRVAPPVAEKTGCILVRAGTHFRVW